MVNMHIPVQTLCQQRSVIIHKKPVFQPQYLEQLSNNKPDNDKAMNAIFEIVAVWDYTVKEAWHNYSYIHSKLSRPLSEELKETCCRHKETFAIYDRVEKVWLIQPSEPTYNFCYNGEKFEDFTEAKKKLTGNRLLLVGKYTILMQEQNLVKAVINPSLFKWGGMRPNMRLIVGVPGCGKTRYIIRNHKAGSLVLTSCTEGAEDIRSRMAIIKGGQPCNYRSSYRTIDSYLINSRARYSEVWMDEALMEHPGKLLLVCVFSQCRSLRLLGDPNQIGYINRIKEIMLQYDKSAMFFKPTDTLNVSYRCPVDVMTILSNNYTYDGGAHSASDVLRSLKTETFTSLQAVPRSRDTKYLVFKQAEKKQMKARGYDVSTVHEFQGKQAARVVLVRTSSDSREQLYQSAPHMLVALSRHTKSLVYYTPVRDRLETLINTTLTDEELRDHQKSPFLLKSIMKFLNFWRTIMFWIYSFVALFLNVDED